MAEHFSDPLLVPILRRKGKYLGTPLLPIFPSTRAADFGLADRSGLAIVGFRARNPYNSPNTGIRFSGSISSRSDTGPVAVY